MREPESPPVRHVSHAAALQVKCSMCGPGAKGKQEHWSAGSKQDARLCVQRRLLDDVMQLVPVEVRQLELVVAAVVQLQHNAHWLWHCKMVTSPMTCWPTAGCRFAVQPMHMIVVAKQRSTSAGADVPYALTACAGHAQCNRRPDVKLVAAPRRVAQRWRLQRFAHGSRTATSGHSVPDFAAPDRIATLCAHDP